MSTLDDALYMMSMKRFNLEATKLARKELANLRAETERLNDRVNTLEEDLAMEHSENEKLKIAVAEAAPIMYSHGFWKGTEQ